jgi:hypothetical protein
VDIRLKEHQRDIKLEHSDNSSIVEHIIEQGDRIQLHNASILTMKARYMDCIVKEAIEIELHFYGINRAGGCFPSKTWKALMKSLKPFGI